MPKIAISRTPNKFKYSQRKAMLRKEEKSIGEKKNKNGHLYLFGYKS
jgi:hypothetical protein